VGDLSPHFSRWEFRCKCGCGFDTVDTQLLEVLEGIRQYYDAPIKVSSGARCRAYNKKIKGAPKSQHPLARACDFTVEGVQPKMVQRYLDLTYPTTLGLGSYEDFTHVDTRAGGPVRWKQ